MGRKNDELTHGGSGTNYDNLYGCPKCGENLYAQAKMNVRKVRAVATK